MAIRNIDLNDHFDLFVAHSIESGHYKNASEVVQAGLRLLEHRERMEAAKLESLRRSVEAGKEAYERGDVTVIEDDAALDRLFDGSPIG
ncbi:MAG: type II toxin-antitoxin system ParD family antitoxin [Alphaproteobacteria bacterium]